MLSDKIKEAVRTAYRAIGDNLENFNPRKQQTFLIAEIAKTLAGEYSKERKIITIEAGTGTGKSLAYSLGAIPLAIARNKKVIISTATVALQEQLVDKDLPFLKTHAGIDFDFTLVKGRQRYVCRQKLSAAVSAQDNPQAGFTFAEKPSMWEIKLLRQLSEALNEGRWQGDRDSWADPIPQHMWQLIQSDRHTCSRSMSEHTHCPFHKARDTMDKADVLVVNHSLLLSDLDMGGGKILPDPADTFYIIDEAHHLPKVTRDHSSAAVSIKGALEWLEKVKDIGDRMAKLVKSQSAISPSIKLADDCTDLITELTKLVTFVENNKSHYFAESNKHNDDAPIHRFEHGLIPKNIKQQSEDMAELSKKCINHTNKLYMLLMEAVKDGEVASYLAEPLLGEFGFLTQRLENFNALWVMYAKTDSEKAAPLARWIELMSGKKQDYLFSASPIEVGFTLEDNLWSVCEGAVLCSATIMALKSFDHFRRQVGLQTNDGTQYQEVSSPFDYYNNATLKIENCQYEPSDTRFTDELIDELPAKIKQSKATLVLFSSYWQMETVAKAIREKQKSLTIQVQGEQSRQHIIEKHKQLCDLDKPSVIFGTQSFSEGLDLPGKYLTNLIITKLPFSVPTSPVEEAQAEYVTAKGGNPFMSISVPDASKKLVQATGRLLRNEADTGTITIMDKRLKTKRYGKDLLNSLPPYKVV